MRSFRGGRRKALLVTAGALLLVLIGAGCHTAANAPHEFVEESMVLTLAPRADGSLLVVDREAFNAASDAAFAMDSSPTGGASRTLASLQGDMGIVSASFTSAPMAKDRYLDLDQPLGGVLYFSNSLTANGVSYESVRIITELYVNGTFAGGGYYEHSSQTSTAVWNMVPVHFRPETHVLPTGSVVELRVSAQNGLGDLKLGVGGAHASAVELAYYPFDPLSGAVFLEKGKLVSALSEDDKGTQRALQFMDSPEFDDLPPGHYVVRSWVDDAPAVHPVPHHPTSAGQGTSPALDRSASREGGTPSQDTAGHPPGVASTQDADRPLGIAMLLALPLLLVGVVGSFPPKRMLPVLLVALLVLAGCAGPKQQVGPTQDPGAPKPSVDSTFEDVEDEDEKAKQTDAGVGTVQGAVTNYFGIPVDGAHVSILATNKFASTQAGGRFKIEQVPAGKYTMRIDAEQLDSLEREIEVQVAKVTNLRITLVPPNGTRADQIQHVHDEWRGAQRKELDSAVVEFATKVYTVTQDGAGECLHSYWEQGSHGTNSQPGCSAPANFEFSSKVLPGTAMVEVVLDWDDSGDNVPALGVSYSNAQRGAQNLNAYLPRGPGEPFYMHVFPNQADPGHQRFTNWQFSIFFYGSDDVPRDSPYSIPPVTIMAHIHKGIVPFEPRHVDRWGEQTRFTLADGTEKRTFGTWYTPASNTLVHEEEGGWTSYDNVGATWVPIRGSWVPPGTARIEGKLIKVPNEPHAAVTLPDPPHIEYTLGYKPANVPIGEAFGNLRVVADATPTDEGYEFTIVPTKDDLDQWYQSATQWTFYLLAKSDIHTYYNTHGFRLEAHAVKDPSWAFDSEVE